jgi:hypothetical protein
MLSKISVTHDKKFGQGGPNLSTWRVGEGLMGKPGDGEYAAATRGMTVLSRVRCKT